MAPPPLEGTRIVKVGGQNNSSRGSGDLIIWDDVGDPPLDGTAVFTWQGYREQGSVQSLLRYVDIHGERLRNKYLAWVHDLGEAKLGRGTNARRLIDRLARRDGLSYWWLTTFVEQSLMYKSPGMVDAIRLLALEEILTERRPASVQLVSANDAVHESLVNLCRASGIAYARRAAAHPPKEARSFARRMYRALPYWARAVVAVTREVAMRWPMRGAARTGAFSGERVVCFLSYFFHLDGDACAAGRFYSRYWEKLPGQLMEEGYRLNWIHHYIESRIVPNTGVALDWTARYNNDQERQGFHTFPDAYLSWTAVARVIVGWLRLIAFSYRWESEIRAAFRPAGSRLSLWPVLRADWYESFRGPTAGINLINIELFDAMLGEFPKQPVGVYVCENQGWERAMLHAWRKHGHGRVIGFSHSTTRFWDLRYFTDERTIRDTMPHALPRPDVLALNGDAAFTAYRDMAYPSEAAAACESLRYAYLEELMQQGPRRLTRDGETRVLILGDYTPGDTEKMLHLLADAVRLVPPGMTFTLKPHPAQPVDVTAFPSISVAVVHDALEKILPDYDVAYSSSATSAAVDAFLAGLPVVVLRDATQLNFSPLRDQAGVCFASSPTELAAALTRDRATSVQPQRDFFYFDTQLSRWKRLLGVDATES